MDAVTTDIRGGISTSANIEQTHGASELTASRRQVEVATPATADLAPKNVP